MRLKWKCEKMANVKGWPISHLVYVSFDIAWSRLALISTPRISEIFREISIENGNFDLFHDQKWSI